MFSCLECLLNQSDKSKLARASFDWLQEEGPAFHSRLQIWNQWENRAKTASAKTQKYIGLFGEHFAPDTSNLDICNSLFFTHTHWFYTVNPFSSSWYGCFCLQNAVHRLAILLAVFGRNDSAKSVSTEKWKSKEYRSYLFCLSMKLQFHNTWIILTKKQ